MAISAPLESIVLPASRLVSTAWLVLLQLPVRELVASLVQLENIQYFPIISDVRIAQPAPPLLLALVPASVGSTVFMAVATNETLRAEFISDVNATCPKLFPLSKIEAQLCIAAGDVIITELIPFLDTEMIFFDWNARALCSNLEFFVGTPVCMNPCCVTPTIPEKLRLALSERSASMSVLLLIPLIL